MNIAILGGSFNPPHIGHTFVCCYVLAATEVDQVWMVPCYRHAFGKPLEAFHHRFVMCRQAAAPLRESRVAVSAIEQERQGTSWTIDTVRALRARHPEHEFLWVIGSDVLTDLGKWRGIAELASMIAFLVVPRSGFLPASDGAGSATNPAVWPSLNIRRDLVAAAGFALPDISSSVIRQRIRAGQSIHHLVAKPVAEYLQLHRLYRS
jgi:nicotinate-nucleotide adenylyltransferase